MRYAAFFLCLFFFILWIPALLGYGRGLRALLRRTDGGTADIRSSSRTETLWETAMLGFFTVIAGGEFLQLWMPLDNLIKLLALAGGLALFSISRANFSVDAADRKIFFWVFAVSALFAFDRINNYDTGLYHLQNIRWFEAQPLPCGLAHIHSRFGFNTLWFVANAIIAPPRFPQIPLRYLPNMLVFFFWGVTVLRGLTAIIRPAATNLTAGEKPSERNPADWYWAFSGFFWAYALLRDISAPTPDYPLLAVGILVCGLALRQQCTADAGAALRQRTAALLIAVLLTTLKLAFGIIAVLLFILWIKTAVRQKAGRLAGKVLLLLTLLCGGWMLRSVLISGVPLYPSTFAYSEKIPWRLTQAAIQAESGNTVGWARSPGAGYIQARHGWQWLAPWLKNNRSALIFWGALCAALVFTGMALAVPLQKNLLLLLLPFANGLFWFFSAPDFRFGMVFFAVGVLYLAAWAAPALSLKKIGAVIQAGGRRGGALVAAAVSLAAAMRCAELQALINPPAALLSAAALLWPSPAAAVSSKRWRRCLWTALFAAVIFYQQGLLRPLLGNRPLYPSVPYKEQKLDAQTSLHYPAVKDDRQWDAPLPAGPAPIGYPLTIVRDARGRITEFSRRETK